jgi:hypothetical protein
MRITGVFDSTNKELGEIVKGGENQLYPCRNMAALTERGGIQAAVQYFPVGEIGQVIAVLSEKLREKIILKDQVTGIADVMRARRPGRPRRRSSASRRASGRPGSRRRRTSSPDSSRTPRRCGLRSSRSTGTSRPSSSGPT